MLAKRTADDSAEHLRAGNLVEAANVLLSGAEELAASGDERLQDVADRLAFCGLRIMKSRDAGSLGRVSAADLERVREDINRAESALLSAAHKVFGHLHDFDALVYVGHLMRHRPLRRRSEGDHSAAIFAAERKLDESEGLSEDDWMELLEKMRAQLDYYEYWRPAPKSGMAAALASRGYVREGAYPRYAKLIQQRRKIEICLDSVKKQVETLTELFSKLDMLESDLLHADLKVNEMVSEINEIVGSLTQQSKPQ